MTTAANLRINLSASDTASTVLLGFQSKLQMVSARLTEIHSRIASVATGPMAAFQAHAEKLNGTLGMLGVGAGVGVAGVGASMVNAAKAAGDFGARIEDISNRTGMTTDLTQGLIRLGGQAGLTSEDIEKGMGKIQVAMDKSLSSGKLDETFARAGVSMQDLEKGSEQVLRKIMDNFKESAGDKSFDPAKFGVLQELFSKSGFKFKEMMEMGAGSLDDMLKKMNEKKEIISKEDIALMGNFQDKTTALGMQFSLFRAQIGIKLIPAFEGLLAKINAFLDTKRVGFLDSVADFANKFDVEKMFTKIGKVLTALAAIASAVSLVVELLGGWENAMYAIAAFKFIGLISSIAGVAASVVGVIGKLGGMATAVAAINVPLGITSMTIGSLAAGVWAALAPLLLIGAAIAAIGFALYGLWKNWDMVTAQFLAGWERIKNAFKQNIFMGFVELFKSYFLGIVNLGIGAINSVAEMIGLKKLALLGDDFGAVQGKVESVRAMAAKEGAQQSATGQGNALSVVAGTQQKVAVGGQVNINVTSDGRARVEQVVQNGDVPMAVNTGMAFFGA